MFGWWDKNEKMPIKYKKNHEVWKELNEPQGWTVKLWGPDEARELVKQKLPKFLETYDGYANPVQRCDAARYFILHEHGGVYADLDYVPNEPLDAMITWIQMHRKHARILVNLSVNNPISGMRTFSNSLMFSEAGAPEWEIAWDKMVERREYYKASSKHYHVLATTGPLLMDAVWSNTKRIQLSSGRTVAPMQTLPTAKFNPCGVCSHGGTCASGAMAYHENTGSWHGPGSHAINFCMCNWVYFFVVIPMLIVFVILSFVWYASRKRLMKKLKKCETTCASGEGLLL